MEKIEHVVNAIYQAFDIDNNGKVGRSTIDLSSDDADLTVSFFLFHQDFQEFVIGFLLTTKGSMEEKLDYTFQLYGQYSLRSLVNDHLCSFQISTKMVISINLRST